MGNKWQIFWTDIPLAILLLLFLNATCNFTLFDERTIHGYILFRRHHLRSINIPKFPNINRLSRSKSSRKDTDLAREGVVTCHEHEKKSRSLFLSLIILLQKPRPFLDLPLYNHYRDTGDNSLGAQRLRYLRQGGEGSEYSRRDRKKTENRTVSHSGEEEARGLASMPRQFRHEMRSSTAGWRFTPTSVEIVFHLEEKRRGRDDALFAPPEGGCSAERNSASSSSLLLREYNS